jgi:hypothetical protein
MPTRESEFNAILETRREKRAEERAKIEIVDNYSLGNRAYGVSPHSPGATKPTQSGDWVHPRPDADAWRGMATELRRRYEALNYNESQ